MNAVVHVASWLVFWAGALGLVQVLRRWGR